MKNFFHSLISVASVCLVMFSCSQIETVDLTPNENLTFKTDSTLPCFDPNKIDVEADCDSIANPVCACGTIPFNNPCEAEAAGFYTYTSGPCVTMTYNCHNPLIEKAMENTQCPNYPNEVCGCNGVTYDNWCEALKSGHTITRRGPCYIPLDSAVIQELKKYVDPDCYDKEHNPKENLRPCGRVVKPVCACKIVEFQNACQARNAGFQNFEEGKCYQNRCQNDDVKFAVKNTVGEDCYAIYDPVCGCDGKTYGNSCQAVQNGVLVYTKGECAGRSGIGNPF